jgi:hypothetical protein
MRKRLDILDWLVLSIALTTLLAIGVPGRGASDSMLTLLSVSSFLFGIFVAFSISDRHSRLKDIRAQLREGDALIFDIYKNSAAFGTKIQEKCRLLLDDWIIATIDYRLVDFHKARSKFDVLYDFVLSLKPSNPKQAVAYDKMVDILRDMNKENKRLRYLVTDRISSYEWGSIVILSGIILFCLFYINTGSLSSMILTVLLSVTLTLLVLVLRDLDQLYWKEQKWIWDPLIDLFNELDLLPYFPDDVFIRKRIKLQPGLKYRVGKYAHPYPDMTDKRIEIVSQ